MTEEQIVAMPPMATKDVTEGQLADLVRKTVVEPQNQSGNSPSNSAGLIYLLAGVADEIEPWGRNSFLRDIQLRRFFGSESFTTSAIATVVARNMGFNWRIIDEQETGVATGDDDRPGSGDARHSMIQYLHDALHSSDLGKGFHDLTAKVSLDLYTQDRGAFVEIIRDEDRPDGKFLGVNHLDAQRCWHTGDPLIPVIYQTRNGKWVKLPWYRVLTLAEMPAPHELLYGLQFCALSRILKAAQIFRNIATYQEEKTGGRYTKAVHIISGVTKQEISDAISIRMAQADAQGLMRYMQPAILATLDPETKPELVTIELASLPESWKLEEMFKWFTVIVAMGLLSDYGDFAPLPGNNLGTAAQSETMAERSNAKGSAIYRSLIEWSFNFKGVIPRGFKFEFAEPNPTADLEAAGLLKARADARHSMIQNGEIDDAAARKMALQMGDISQEIYDEMETRAAEAEAAQEEMMSGLDQFSDLEFEEPAAGPQIVKARTTIPKRAGPNKDRLALEDEYAARIEPALKKARDQVARRLRKLA